ncbi:uncharacterized protein [Primulina huaijiensis]|uniref:uncharacterized protein n=1 Tax=Primulina huaijiensis TaxID=1492673 RepID=UPI003CC6ECBE
MITWKVFKAEFYRRFFPGSYRENKRVEFENLKQGQLNIEEYVAKFSTLLRFAHLIAGNDEAVADQFINGLNAEIVAVMKIERPHHFADVLNKAKRAEAILIRELGRLDVSRPQIQQSPLRVDSDSTSGKHDLLKARKKQFKKNQSIDSQDTLPKSVVQADRRPSSAYVLLDTGASHTFIFERIALKHAFPVESLSAVECMTKGAERFLVYSVDVLKSSPSLADLPVVCEFGDVFPDEILGLPPVQEIDFSIELIPGTVPLSKAPYRMEPVELKELKDQLEDLLAKGILPVLRDVLDAWEDFLLLVGPLLCPDL